MVAQAHNLVAGSLADIAGDNKVDPVDRLTPVDKSAAEREQRAVEPLAHRQVADAEEQSDLYSLAAALVFEFEEQNAKPQKAALK